MPPRRKCGERRDEDDKIFLAYKPDGREIWLSPRSYHRNRVNSCLQNARARSARREQLCTVDVDYLLGLFPEPPVCPVLGTRMSWGGGNNRNDHSPSLDRIDGGEGYVPGNLRWISNRANSLKSNATPDELEAVLAYMKAPHA